MKRYHNPLSQLAEGPGFEPGLTGPEPVVLPLDDPSVVYSLFIYSVFVNASSKFMVWAVVNCLDGLDRYVRLDR